MTIREIVSRYRYSLALIMAFYLVQVVESSINPLYMTRLMASSRSINTRSL